MNTSSKHPTRLQLLKAVQSGRNRFAAHLKECEACRLEYDLLSSFGAPGADFDSGPSAEAIRRYTAIPMLEERRSPSRQIGGRVSFDSWQQRAVAGVRDIPEGLVRRLCLTARDVVLELVGERRQNRWAFVARVYRKNEVSSDFVLKVGRKKLAPGKQGFFLWSQPGTPRSLALLGVSTRIDFEKITW